MKTFKEFVQDDQISQINENPRIRDMIISKNEGREGQQAIGVDGKEVSKSVYLGDADIATMRSGGVIVIEKYNQITGRFDIINISKQHLKWLNSL